MEETKLREIIERAGGIYVGTMKLRRSLVLFNSPITGSTLAVKEEECSLQKVKDKLDKEVYVYL